VSSWDVAIWVPAPPPAITVARAASGAEEDEVEERLEVGKDSVMRPPVRIL
jgi:hypothetical protein